MAERLLHSEIESPVGSIHLLSTVRGLAAIALGPSALVWLDRFRARAFKSAEPESAGVAHAAIERQLHEYFAGRRRAFDLPLDVRGSDFQMKVWAAVQRIPFGRTTAYSTLAVLVDSPRASRAVGAANGANPLPIVIPCHRVVGARGELTGYGGGLSIKRWLLTHEGVLKPAPVQMGLFRVDSGKPRASY